MIGCTVGNSIYIYIHMVHKPNCSPNHPPNSAQIRLQLSWAAARGAKDFGQLLGALLLQGGLLVPRCRSKIVVFVGFKTSDL